MQYRRGAARTSCIRYAEKRRVICIGFSAQKLHTNVCLMFFNRPCNVLGRSADFSTAHNTGIYPPCIRERQINRFFSIVSDQRVILGRFSIIGMKTNYYNVISNIVNDVVKRRHLCPCFYSDGVTQLL